MPDAFRCTIITPQQQVFDGQVNYISLPAWDGQLGIEINRAPLLVQLGDGILTLKQQGSETKLLFVSGGFAQMTGEQLTILTDTALSAAEIQAPEVQAALQAALAQVARTDEEQRRKTRQIARARAMLELAAK